MGVGKVVGYSTLLEGMLGIEARDVRLTSGWERAGQVGVGFVQTAFSAVVAAELFHAATTTSGSYGATSEGRPLTRHYGIETGPKRNIPGSVVDNTINTVKGVPGRNSATVYYDPVNNVTVVTGRNGIMSAHKGRP